jgi:hypothetical protein
MATFEPPSRVLVPVVTPNVPKEQQRPFAYFKPSIPRGINVWINTFNEVTEIQPPLWLERTVTDADGNKISVTPGVKKVYYGGHIYTINDDEKRILTEAGYGANIVG